jgi:hypothetical protein
MTLPHRRLFSIRIVVVVLVAALALVAGCGGGDGPSQEEALSEFSDFDKAAVRSHNAVTPKFTRTFDCINEAGPAQWGSCTGSAKAYLGAIEREQRKLKRAYEDAPDYVQKVYGDYYRMHRRANAADHTYANQVLEVTRSMKAFDIARAKRALPRMNRAADKSKQLDDRSEKLLEQARSESEDYVRSL